MDQLGQIADSGTYECLVQRQTYFSEHQSDTSPKSAPTEPIPTKAQELEASREEYQSRVQTKVDDLRRKKGDLKSFTYYLGAMGRLGFLAFVIGTSAYVVLNAIFGVWLVWWADDTHGAHSLGYWLGLYATWAVLITLGVLATPVYVPCQGFPTIILTFCRYFFTTLATKASRMMHADLLKSTMRSVQYFGFLLFDYSGTRTMG
jgi:hypothetical protein